MYFSVMNILTAVISPILGQVTKVKADCGPAQEAMKTIMPMVNSIAGFSAFGKLALIVVALAAVLGAAFGKGPQIMKIGIYIFAALVAFTVLVSTDFLDRMIPGLC